MTGWVTVPLQWLVRQSDVRAGAGCDGLPLLSVSIATGVGPRSEAGQAASEDLSNYKVVRAGQIVLNRMRAFQGAVGMATTSGLVSPEYTVLTVDDGEPRFFEYLMRSAPFVSAMTSSLRGIGDPSSSNVRTPRINFTELGQLRVTVPRSRLEQARIADHLDAKRARIERLQRAVGRQLALAEEQLASHCAALLFPKGGSPFSQLPGAAPVGYRPLWLAASTFAGKTLQSVKLHEDERETPYLKASNIGRESVSLDALDTMWATGPEREALRIAAGDVFIIEGGATAGKAAMLAEDPGATIILQNHVHCVRARPGFNQRYLYWVLRAYYESGWYPTLTSAVTFGSFPAEKLRSLPVPDVEPAAQLRLANNLDEILENLTQVREQTSRMTALLEERKKVLIAVAVTGQTTV